MDLHKVTLPTFVLEPRSMLERITDFMSHPELVLQAPALDDPVDRFVDVLRYYLSGWHIKPKGVKKPYNPILGEFFRARYKFGNGTEAFFVSEQVSHHPPVSAYVYLSPENQLMIEGEVKPKSKFLGNSTLTEMQGGQRIIFLNRPDEVYEITLPNMYARGILFGTMLLELGDSVTVRCSATDLVADIDFKTKGFFSGSYNVISGKVKRISTSETLFELGGKWSDVMTIKRKGGKETELFNAAVSPITSKFVVPEDQQAWNESRRLWSKVTAALLQRNLDLATEEKTAIEEEQRRAAKEREDTGVDFSSFWFDCVDGSWVSKTRAFPKNPLEARKLAEAYVFSKTPAYNRHLL